MPRLSAPSRRSPQARSRWSAGALAAAALLAVGCGGSASETPFPQSAHEVAAIPVLQRPRPKAPKQPPLGMPPGPGSPAPPPEEE